VIDSPPYAGNGGPHPKDPAPSRRRWLLRAGCCLGAVVLLSLAVNDLRFDLRSYALLKHFTDPHESGVLLAMETREVKTEEVTIPAGGRAAMILPPHEDAPASTWAAPSHPVRARLYWPRDVARPGGMVVVHGIHHLGMDEPRLMSFSHALAASGLAVLTPQLDSLADYTVDASSIAAIGESAAYLDERLGHRKVTLIGISFAGGLSLLAATEPHYASHLRALVLMGAYDDLARVSRFLATGRQELPDGESEEHPVHDYGASVFIYAHLDQFFPASDRAVAHDALRDWLWEEPERAKPLLDKLNPTSRATLNALLERRIDLVRPQMLSAILADQAELEAVSPRGHVASLRVPVYILHGSADDIIPPAESLWLAQDLPRDAVRDVLITGAFAHVDPAKDASIWEELRLVHFIAGVLKTAN
jgi:pimeloyl-ACP methyl ester carboxylesterase